MRKVPLQPQTSRTDSGPDHLYFRLLPFSLSWKVPDKLVENFSSKTVLSQLSFSAGNSLTFCHPTFDQLSPHIPTKPKHSKAQWSRKQFAHFPRYKVGGVGVWGAPAGPLVLPDAGRGGRAFHHITPGHHAGCGMSNISPVLF